MKRALIVVLFQSVVFISMAPRDSTPNWQTGVKSTVDARSFPELFQKLENQVADAIQAKDTATLDGLLAPEFIVRTSSHPMQPVSRKEWFRILGKDSGAGQRIRSEQPTPLAIRAFGGGICQASAVVSFVGKELAHSSTRGKSYLIIDIWETDTTKTWRLAQRYINQMSSTKAERTHAK